MLPPDTTSTLEPGPRELAFTWLLAGSGETAPSIENE
jgi:hypothetical protein